MKGYPKSTMDKEYESLVCVVRKRLLSNLATINTVTDHVVSCWKCHWTSSVYCSSVSLSWRPLVPGRNVSSARRRPRSCETSSKAWERADTTSVYPSPSLRYAMSFYFYVFGVTTFVTPCREVCLDVECTDLPCDSFWAAQGWTSYDWSIFRTDIRCVSRLLIH